MGKILNIFKKNPKKIVFGGLLTLAGIFAEALHDTVQNDKIAQEHLIKDPRDLIVMSPDNTAIIVYTGETDRIALGLNVQRYLNAPVFVSGCLPEFKETLEKHYNNIATDIEFGCKAEFTIQNAFETEDWLKARPEITKVIIITANYHIGSAYELTREALPENIKINIVQLETFDSMNRELGDRLIHNSFLIGDLEKFILKKAYEQKTPLKARIKEWTPF